jgi:hypothetical protein
VNRHCPTPPRFRIQVNRIRDHRCTVSLGGGGVNLYPRCGARAGRVSRVKNFVYASNI